MGWGVGICGQWVSSMIWVLHARCGKAFGVPLVLSEAATAKHETLNETQRVRRRL